MYVVASDNRQISLVSSCFDCFACTTCGEDDKKHCYVYFESYRLVGRWYRMLANQKIDKKCDDNICLQ